MKHYRAGGVSKTPKSATCFPNYPRGLTVAQTIVCDVEAQLFDYLTELNHILNVSIVRLISKELFGAVSKAFLEIFKRIEV